MKRLIALVALVLPLLALAHKPSDSYLTIRGDDKSADLAVRWDRARRDLDYVLELDRDGNGALTWGEVRTRSDDIVRYATDRLALEAGDRKCAWQTSAPLQLDHHSFGTYAVLSLVAKFENFDLGLKMGGAL